MQLQTALADGGRAAKEETERRKTNRSEGESSVKCWEETAKAAMKRRQHKERMRGSGGGRRGEICPLADGQLVAGRGKGHGDLWRSCLRSEGDSWSACNAEAAENQRKWKKECLFLRDSW